MRSAILVDSVLDYDVKGEHVHIMDEGGAVHLAFTRSTFFANLARMQAVALAMCAADRRKIAHLPDGKLVVGGPV
jgi:hypothetical protein